MERFGREKIVQIIILCHLESWHVASKCLFRSRSSRSKNVIGIAQMVASDLIYAAVKQQKKMKKILTIKLNLSSNLVIEFHSGELDLRLLQLYCYL